ncbi:MAG: type II toxin-antitoxin system RelE/ParE family toxin [Nitrospirales bacterium]|nr:type II toxin-antitoxin system RelE/ParE family toxin [Nitrospirales bacterium]
MAAELIVAPEAEQDVAEAHAWSKVSEPVWGREFFICVDACIEAICRIPEMYTMVFENNRRGLVRRFPYVIFYEYVEDQVTVYGIFHTARDPEKWRQRLH